MDLPPTSHFIYIPAVAILGIVLGFILGARSTREAIRLEQQRAEARAQRKADRARKASMGQEPQGDGHPSPDNDRSAPA